MKSTVISLLISFVLTAAMVTYVWVGYKPAAMEKAEIAATELRCYLVEEIPELAGASQSDISFDVDNLYHVTYKGERIVISDAAVQNNIAAFKEKYSINYRANVNISCGMLTFLACIIGLLIYLVCLVLRDPIETLIINIRYAIHMRKKRKMAT